MLDQESLQMHPEGGYFDESYRSERLGWISWTSYRGNIVVIYY